VYIGSKRMPDWEELAATAWGCVSGCGRVSGRGSGCGCLYI